MSLKSMTGYGRSEGKFKHWSWVWEVRSVNGKSLDIRLRLPIGFEALEPKIRNIIAATLKRGNLQITLNLQAEQGISGFKINHQWIAQLMNDGEAFAHKFKLNRSNLADLYQVSGVIIEDNIQNVSDPKLTKRNLAILSNLEEMLATLITARTNEGMAMEAVLSSCVSDMAHLTHQARKCASATPVLIKQKLADKIENLLGEGFENERFAQEVALLAIKADVREELDRLDAHIVQAKALIKSDKPIGRKLDFLSQEFIREINTLCSKSIDIDLTQIGLQMKSVVEQFREQAANIE